MGKVNIISKRKQFHVLSDGSSVFLNCGNFVSTFKLKVSEQDFKKSVADALILQQKVPEKTRSYKSYKKKFIV